MSAGRHARNPADESLLRVGVMRGTRRRGHASGGLDSREGGWWGLLRPPSGLHGPSRAVGHPWPTLRRPHPPPPDLSQFGDACTATATTPAHKRKERLLFFWPKPDTYTRSERLPAWVRTPSAHGCARLRVGHGWPTEPGLRTHAGRRALSEAANPTHNPQPAARTLIQRIRPQASEHGCRDASRPWTAERSGRHITQGCALRPSRGVLRSLSRLQTARAVRPAKSGL